MRKEIWVEIKEYPDYEISDQGRVMSKERLVTYPDGHKHLVNSKILIPRKTGAGYMSVALFNKDGRQDFSIHRLVAFAFCEMTLFSTEVNHKNGIKNDNRAENLEWVTHKENMEHSVNNFDFTERYKKVSERMTGSKHPLSKLDEKKVKEIKELKKNGLIAKEIGKMYGVDRTTINDILTNRTWVHVN